MKHKFKMGAIFIPIFIGGILLFSLLVMLLWNGILPSVFAGVKAITYLQAIGILVLSKVLFGFNKSWGAKRHGCKYRMYEKFESMTFEEREKFKTEWKNRCGGRWSSFENKHSEENKETI